MIKKIKRKRKEIRQLRSHYKKNLKEKKKLYYAFDLVKVKIYFVFRTKIIVYEFRYELQNDLRVRILGNLEKSEDSRVFLEAEFSAQFH